MDGFDYCQPIETDYLNHGDEFEPECYVTDAPIENINLLATVAPAEEDDDSSLPDLVSRGSVASKSTATSGNDPFPLGNETEDSTPTFVVSVLDSSVFQLVPSRRLLPTPFTCPSFSIALALTLPTWCLPR